MATAGHGRPTFTVEMLSPETLQANPHNFRRHPEEQRLALAASLEEFGTVAAPIWNRKTGHLIDGHARVDLALLAGEKQIPVNVVDLPLAKEKRLLRSFDRIAAMAEIDTEALDALIAEIDDAALEQLLGMVAESASGLLPEADPDALPERVETRCKAGDLWQLGEHRLGCLDCRDEAALFSLLGETEPAIVFADPPYGLSIVDVKGFIGGGAAYEIPFGGKKSRGSVGAAKPFGSIGGGKIVKVGLYAPVIGDESTDTALDAFRLCEGKWPGAVQVWWGGNHYAGFLPCSSAWLVWDKENTGNFADVELAWTNQKTAARLFRHMWNGLMKASERGEKRVHPTQKPVALAEWVYGLYGSPGDRVFDPFAGSGMSLIAAESTGRLWSGCELSPEYCDVILARWEQATGKKAVRL